MKTNKIPSFCSLLLVLLCGCGQSFDLGKEAPIEVAFSGDGNTWDSGIGQVFKLKCVNCHTSLSTRSRFVPANTPTTVNGMSHSSFFDTSSYAGLVYDRMFSNPVNPMPPHFATPLTSNENTKVKAWLETKTVSIASLCGTGSTALQFADIQSTIASDCGSCHNGSMQVSLGSLSASKSYRRMMLSYLNSGTMPPSNASYRTGTNGSQLYTWLCFGTDL
jgi:uncharacterized membrane protein